MGFQFETEMSSNIDGISVLNVTMGFGRARIHSKKFPKYSQTSFSSIVKARKGNLIFLFMCVKKV